DQALEGELGGQREAGVSGLDETLQLVDCTSPYPGQRVVDGLLQSVRQRRGSGDRPAAAGEGQGGLQVEGPLARCLVRSEAAYPLVHVVVEFIQSDVAVLVTVGVAGLQALDERAGEHRRARAAVVSQVLALKGVLHGAGRGDDGATA